MRGKPLSRAITAISAIALVVGQFLLPANVALATNTNNNGRGQEQSGSTNGTSLAVWCQVVGNGWTAQLGGSNSNRTALTVLPAGTHPELSLVNGQVFATNSADSALQTLLDQACTTSNAVVTDTNGNVNAGNNPGSDNSNVNGNQDNSGNSNNNAGGNQNNGNNSGSNQNNGGNQNDGNNPPVVDNNGGGNDNQTPPVVDNNGGNNNNNGGNNSDGTGTPQPVWCQATGYGWTAQLGNENSGGNNPNRVALTVLPVGADPEIVFMGENGQVYAYNSSNPTLQAKLDDACVTQFTLPNPTVVTTPVCGPNNDTFVVSTNANYTAGSASWVNNKLTVVFTAKDGYVFSNGETTYSVSVYDNNTLCVANFTLPTVVNQCFIVNDSVTLPADTAGVHYSKVYVPQTNSYTITIAAKDGYILSNGLASYTYTVNMADTPEMHCQNGMGGLGEVTPPTVTVAAAPVAAAPVTEAPVVSELPHTGPSTNGALTVLGLVASMVTYGAALALQRRHGTA